MEDFVTFEIAKKLKEKGFPQVTFGNYAMQSACYVEDGRFYENGCITEVSRAYTAPTISQVLKWLREDKKIHIAVDIMRPYPQSQITNWGYNIVLIDKYEVYHFNWNLDTYDESVLDGIEYVLDNLI